MTNAETQEKDTAKALNDEVDQAADRAADLRAAFEERASAAREWAADQTDVLRDTVQTKPFIAIGVSAASAFAAGLVLGVLLTRR
jgi:ElaB/YqjD/DUF883 family membrane-anchored ribosome-binding protein